ncbi:MAG: hypothetical protein ACRDQZ_23555, partial [Mycobacteriales bacterium]
MNALSLVAPGCSNNALDGLAERAILVAGKGDGMTPLELVQLPPLMALTSGGEDIVVALLDGPVVLDHMGRRGLGAPGEEVTSLSPRGAPHSGGNKLCHRFCD